jgi:YidC/Oxa1 family membrane protein insertase
MTEGIGYLKAIGLDYGYGPTASIEWVLEHIHIMGGLPWWGAIAATAVLIRAVTFPLYLKSADQAARQAALVSVTKPLTDQLKAAQSAGDQTGVMQAWTKINAVRKRAGLSYMQQFTPMLVQAVLGFCSFKLMRAMSALPVPGMQTGGFGWVTDLTVSDGYLLLPALMAGTMHVMFRYGGETGNSDMVAPGMRSFMLWGMPGLVFIMTGWQTAAVCIWFVASGGWAMGQAMLMQKPAVRKFFGVTPMYKSTKKETTKGSVMDLVMGSTKSKTVDTTATVKGSWHTRLLTSAPPPLAALRFPSPRHQLHPSRKAHLKRSRANGRTSNHPVIKLWPIAAQKASRQTWPSAPPNTRNVQRRRRRGCKAVDSEELHQRHCIEEKEPRRSDG